MGKKMKGKLFEATAVNKNVTKAAQRLAPMIATDFYLAGGTALALQLGHRISLDLDFFSNQNLLSTIDRSHLITELKKSGPVEILESSEGTCHLKLESVLVSLFRYDYALLKPLSDKWHTIPIAHTKDIAAMKLSAIVGRGTKKDFVDIFFLSKKFGLKMIFSAGEEKFPDQPNFIMQATRALLYFEDAEKDPMPRLLKQVPWPGIKKFFLTEVPKLVKSWIQ